MKFLTIGDIHFKLDNALESEQFTNEIINHVKNNKYDFIVVLGDILHTFERSHVQPMNRAYHLLTELEKYSKVYLIIGNHDRPNNNVFMTEEHFFNSFKDKICVVDKSIRDGDFVFVPYVPPGRFEEALKDIDMNGVKMIFAHQEFRGCDLDDGKKSEVGDEWEGVVIVSGHIHSYGRVGRWILYVGTPFQHSYRDSEKKYVLAFSSNSSFDESEEKFGSFFYKKIKLNVIKKRIINIGIDEFKKLGKDNIDKNYITKYVVIGDVKVIGGIVSKSELRGNKNVVISIVPERREVSIEKSEGNFKESLKELVKGLSKELREEYNEIFGS